MAGALFGIPLSQWRNADGTPMAGALLYIYEAGTSTPADTFEDYGLTVGLELPHPIEADANGLIPPFWVADGSYRARLTNSAGSLVLFDSDGIQAIGPSSGEGGGGGGISATAVFQTGDTLWTPTTGTRSGWVRANARTIGSATSGATERANADTQPLYELLWNTYSDTICPVVGGRGASAAADFAANKPIVTLDMRGLAAVGVPDMGNGDSTRLDDVTFAIGNKTTAASLCGAALQGLTIANLPIVTPAGAVSQVQLQYTRYNTLNPVGTDGPVSTNVWKNESTQSTTAQTPTFTGTPFGSNTAHNNMQPSMTGSWFLKL